jgi:hypothetical protein
MCANVCARRSRRVEAFPKLNVRLQRAAAAGDEMGERGARGEYAALDREGPPGDCICNDVPKRSRGARSLVLTKRNVTSRSAHLRGSRSRCNDRSLDKDVPHARAPVQRTRSVMSHALLGPTTSGFTLTEEKLRRNPVLAEKPYRPHCRLEQMTNADQKGP